LILAFVLDLCIGDPQWAPHPVRVIGAAANRTEDFLRKLCHTPLEKRWGGMLLVLLIVPPAYLLTGLVVREEGLLVRDCSNFSGLDGSYIRIAVRSHRENAALIKELARTCAA